MVVDFVSVDSMLEAALSLSSPIFSELFVVSLRPLLIAELTESEDMFDVFVSSAEVGITNETVKTVNNKLRRTIFSPIRLSVLKSIIFLFYLRMGFARKKFCFL